MFLVMYRSVSVNVNRDDVIEFKAVVSDLVSVGLEDDKRLGGTEKVRIKVEQRKTNKDGACAHGLHNCDRCVVQDIISDDSSRDADHGSD